MKLITDVNAGFAAIGDRVAPEWSSREDPELGYRAFVRLLELGWAIGIVTVLIEIIKSL